MFESYFVVLPSFFFRSIVVLFRSFRTIPIVYANNIYVYFTWSVYNACVIVCTSYSNNFLFLFSSSFLSFYLSFIYLCHWHDNNHFNSPYFVCIFRMLKASIWSDRVCVHFMENWGCEKMFFQKDVTSTNYSIHKQHRNWTKSKTICSIDTNSFSQCF